jgi:hypothetical protein
MRLRVSALTCLVALCVLALTSAALSQTTQSSSSTSVSPSGKQKSSSGQKTVVGCVAREGEGFVLKTDQGTYEFATSRDLTPWVGKKVRLTGRWSSTGVTTAAPITAAEVAASPTDDAKKISTAKSFAGDLHVHITGDVIGDCAETK